MVKMYAFKYLWVLHIRILSRIEPNQEQITFLGLEIIERRSSLSIKSDNCRATQENESNLRTKSSNQDKQFSIESLLGKEDCQNICIVSTNT